MASCRGRRNNILTGTKGATHFEITAHANEFDIVIGVELSEANEHIDLSRYGGVSHFDQLIMEDIGSDTIIYLENNQILALKGIQSSDLNESNFIFKTPESVEPSTESRTQYTVTDQASNKWNSDYQGTGNADGLQNPVPIIVN